jgi:hypothetical protein
MPTCPKGFQGSRLLVCFVGDTKHQLNPTKAMKSSINLQKGIPSLPILLALGWLALCTQAQAVVPAPDGGYPGGNTAEGDDALFSLTTGIGNTAAGFQALLGNTDGGGNTAVGQIALTQNVTGSFNTAVGGGALSSTVDGSFNTAVGYDALVSNTAYNNTALGNSALFENTTGAGNTAVGLSALQSNVSGFDNTAVGTGALVASTAGSNTAVGSGALSNTTSGGFNTAVGYNAGLNQNSGSNNVYIGAGVNGVAGENDTIRIGTQGSQTKTFIAGISGTTLGNGVAVRVNANGRLGIAPSSMRFKQDIRPMDNASEAILTLKPVTFRYKQDLDPERVPQFGLVAEEVEKVNPDLVARDAGGKPYTVRYDAVNAMLLNEFLKQHKALAEEQEKVKALEGTIAGLVATVKEQALQIQRVTTQVEMSKSAPQAVATNP